MWKDISLDDMETICLICDQGSIRSVARQKRVEAATVSKAVSRVEKKLKAKLFQRSVKGVLPTAEGVKFFTAAKEIIHQAQQYFSELSGTHKNTNTRCLTIAAPSFISQHFLPENLGKLSKDENISFRILELLPDQLISLGVTNAFEMAIHIGSVDWPRTWTSTNIGNVRWGLFAKKNHAIGVKTTEEKLKAHGFVMPSYFGASGFFTGNDLCPLSTYKRRRGFETQSATTAIQIVLHTDQLAYVPEIAARPYVQNGSVAEVMVDLWPAVVRECYLSVKSDSISKRMFQNFERQMKKSLSSKAQLQKVSK